MRVQILAAPPEHGTAIAAHLDDERLLPHQKFENERERTGAGATVALGQEDRAGKRAFGRIRTHLARLIDAADTPSAIVQAERAPYSKKEMLKARGYRWNPDGPFWQIELPPQKVEHEQAWGYRNGLPTMTTRTVTAHERHR
ncbi:hypothetical protein [Qipengyuania flava]|uniref:hypothetical protein n=1 Tax=Qipengyuania flava TaxID=192812 RepID=UPI001CD411FC|nr:hypothetical protein [Qipengyuania flava]MCA0889529.1 hypothetical protein [Qipengyuania flava]